MKVLYPLLALIIASAGTQAFADKKSEKPNLSKEKAQEVALKAVPGELLGWCLEIDNGVPTYAFEIKGKDLRIREVEVDGDTGEKVGVAIEIEQGGEGGDRKSNNTEDLAKLKEAKVSREKAQEKALLKFSGKVEKWELEYEEDRLVYEFLISAKGNKKVVGVDAKDGNITEITKYIDGSSF